MDRSSEAGHPRDLQRRRPCPARRRLPAHPATESVRRISPRKRHESPPCSCPALSTLTTAGISTAVLWRFAAPVGFRKPVADLFPVRDDTRPTCERSAARRLTSPPDKTAALPSSALTPAAALRLCRFTLNSGTDIALWNAALNLRPTHGSVSI